MNFLQGAPNTKSHTFNCSLQALHGSVLTSDLVTVPTLLLTLSSPQANRHLPGGPRQEEELLRPRWPRWPRWKLWLNEDQEWGLRTKCPHKRRVRLRALWPRARLNLLCRSRTSCLRGRGFESPFPGASPSPLRARQVGRARSSHLPRE